MDKDTFDSVAWEDVTKRLLKKPRMIHSCDSNSKQCSGFCVTGDRLSKWDPNECGMCPNCGAPESAELYSDAKAQSEGTYYTSKGHYRRLASSERLSPA